MKDFLRYIHFVGSPEYWRNKEKLLRLTGYQRENGKEVIEVSFSGSNWTQLTEERCIKITSSEGTIYKTSKVSSFNGRKIPVPLKEQSLLVE